MQVTCPSCGARYAVDPMAIGPDGRTVQCVRCSHRWRERPIAPAALAPPPPPPSQASSPAPSLRSAPDFASRTATAYTPALPPLSTPAAQFHWGRWLAGAVVLVAVLGIAAFAFRHEITSRLPPEWSGYVDSLRGLLRR